MAEIVYKDESYAIIGACFEVYNEMGTGFVEPVYQQCLEIELCDREIPFVPQSSLELRYKRKMLEQTYKPDFICHGKIIVEIKAVSVLTDEHPAQVHNYLKATRFHLGLLVNFGQHPRLQYQRIVK
jgi:GxxExxY protein